MKIILASSNAHKLKEFKAMMKDYELFALNEVLTPFEIIENGTSFKENALIKARAIFKALSPKMQKEFIVLSDDSGISVKALANKPGIHSARFSQEQTDKANRQKLILELKKLNLEQSEAFYTAALAVVGVNLELCTHGFLHGTAQTQELGTNGFGYDSLFIPLGFDKTLAQLDENVKAEISHRKKALDNALFLLNFYKEKGKI